VLSTCQLIRQAKDGGTKDRSAAHSNAIAALDGITGLVITVTKHIYLRLLHNVIYKTANL